MNMNLLATGLDENLAQIVEKLKGLIDSFWIYIVIALAAVVVIWGAYIGIVRNVVHKHWWATNSEKHPIMILAKARMIY